jgi:hypothetical protein
MGKVIRMKKAMCLLLLILLFSFSLVPEAFAVNLSGVITPYYSYTNTTKTDLYISSSGLATATGNVVGYQDKTTKVNMYLYLQRYDGSNWVNIENWSKSDENYRLTLTGTSYVSKGYTYRVKAYYYVYSGTDYESIIRYSNNVIF